MMNKMWKGLLLTGMAICMIGSGVASAKLSLEEKTARKSEVEKVQNSYSREDLKKLQEKVEKEQAELSPEERIERDQTSRDILSDAGVGSSGSGRGIAKVLTPTGWIIVDIASGPAHATIMALQKVLPKQVEKLKKEKMEIRKRMSVRKKKKEESEDASGENDSTSKSNSDWYYYDREDGVMAEKGEKIDAKLSKIKIKSKEVTDMAGDGIVGTGVDDIIITQGNTSAQDLFDEQQKKYISAAGTEEEQEKYEQLRQYNEQEQAVQMIAYAATVRQNVADTIEKMVEKVNEHYDASGDKKNCDYGCVKRDLDIENKEEKVHKNADYNQVLREYAYYSLVYDQLLSLEQQIVGLRLQVKGTDSEQKSTALSDVLKTEREP